MALQRPTNSRVASLASALLALLVVASNTHAVAGEWNFNLYTEWRTGRATRYGAPDDQWDIHDGHCWHKYLSPNVNTGWDVAAFTDVMSEWGPDIRGMCGLCVEVRCKNMKFKDGFGQELDRQNVCYDQSASLIVQITDICPCDYPANMFSNKRWCCGDMQHLDLSTYAFEKLADKKWGVIGLEYRFVPCGVQPNKVATLPPGQSSSPARPAPPGFTDAQDPRPRRGFENSRVTTSSRASGTAGTQAASGVAQAPAPTPSTKSGPAKKHHDTKCSVPHSL